MNSYSDEYLKQNQIPLPRDGEKYKYKPLTQNEKVGVLLANVFLPGIGSLYVGFTRSWTYYIVVGFIQMFTAFILVGFLWSIGSGVWLFTHLPALVAI